MDRKKKRTSKKQFQIYVRFLENHDKLRTGKLGPHDDPKTILKLWDTMAMELNAAGDGPTRNSQEWKKVFREWKGAVRKRARENKELSQLEQKLLDLTGTLSITGLDLQEIGVDMEYGDQQNGVNREHEDEENGVDSEDENADALEETAATMEKETLENALDEATQFENGEVFVIQVEDNEAQPASKQKPKKGTRENPLLTAYRDGQKSERKGLSEIAKALDNVAKGIDRFCDLYEKVHLNDLK